LAEKVMATGAVRRDHQLGGVEQGAVETQGAVSIETDLQAATLLAVDPQAHRVFSGGKTRRVQQHAGQLRVDTALVEGLGVKAFSVIGPGHVGEQGAAQ
jgi:hypothetical protein